MSLLKSTTTTLASVVLSGLLANSAIALEFDSKKIDRLEKDMKIMTRILQTSLQEDGKDSARINGLYLANQGMLFTVEPRGGFNFHFGSFTMPAIAVQPTKPVLAPNVHIDITDEDDLAYIEEQAMAAAEIAMEQAEESIERMSEHGWSFTTRSERDEHRVIERELRKEKRELDGEARKIEREVRTLERKLRDAEFAEELAKSNENNEKVTALKKEISKLSEKLNAVSKRVQEKSAQIAKKAEEMRAKQVEKQKEQLAKMESTIASTVCDFGSGLRSLPKDQNMTFSIEGSEKYQIYVFEKQHIDDCGDGKITASQLLDKAIRYSM